MCGHCPFPLGLGECKIFFVPSKTGVSFSPQSCGSPIIKSHWPSVSGSLGVPSSFVASPGWEAWLRTFTTVEELLWYYCFLVCGSSTQQVWDLTLLCLYPSYRLTVASSSYTWGIFFLVGSSVFLLIGCSTGSCDFGALTGGDEHLSF